MRNDLPPLMGRPTPRLSLGEPGPAPGPILRATTPFQAPPPLPERPQPERFLAERAAGQRGAPTLGRAVEASELAREAEERLVRERLLLERRALEQAAREQAEREATARAAQRRREQEEEQEREARERAAAVERVRREQEAREQARLAAEAAERERQERAAAERARQEQEARERAAQERAAAERARREQEAREQARLAAEAAERERQEREAAEQARREQEARERAAQARAAAERARREQEAREQARLAAEAAERERQEREAAEQARREQEARERAAQERAAAEQARREQEAREQARLAAEAAERERREREAQARAAAEQARREQEAREQARVAAEAVERERREREAQERAAAERAHLEEEARQLALREQQRLEREELERLEREAAQQRRLLLETEARLARERKLLEQEARERAARERQMREWIAEQRAHHRVAATRQPSEADEDEAPPVVHQAPADPTDETGPPPNQFDPWSHLPAPPDYKPPPFRVPERRPISSRLQPRSADAVSARSSSAMEAPPPGGAETGLEESAMPERPSRSSNGGSPRRTANDGRGGSHGGGGRRGGGRPNGGGGGPRKPRSLFRRMIGWFSTLCVWMAVGVLGMVGYYALTLPDIESATAVDRQPSITLVAADGSMLGSTGDLYGRPITISELPPYVPQAILAIEDRRFYSHPGVDPIGLARAAFKNLISGGVRQGGSTITQQLAKNLFLTPDRTLGRKIQELLLAFWLEHRFDKDQILALYLNRVYLGWGAYGIDGAAHRYYGKSAAQLDLWQAATLAALLKAPTRYNPARYPERSAQRAEMVLASMVDAGFIAQDQADRAVREKVKPLPGATGSNIGARWFIDWVQDQVPAFVGYVDRDLVVTTTLDPALQKDANETVRSQLEATHKKPDGPEQAALVTLSPDGAVRAMIGGQDYTESQFNRATQAQRQPGSAFKPFVYLTALEMGIGPNDTMMDSPISIGNWAPGNFGDKYYGEVSIRDALARSLNSVTVQLVQRFGPNRLIETARRMGISSKLEPNLSLALGTAEVNPLELTAAYAVLLNHGQVTLPYAITEIRDREGTVLYRRAGDGGGQAIDPANAARLNEMLAGVVNRGTGRAARLDRPVAGKTGTTQDSRDAWFVGFTGNFVTAVWVGNDDNRPMAGMTGGQMPARMWKTFMAQAESGRKPAPIDGITTPPPPMMAALPPGAVPVSDLPWLRGERPSTPSRPRTIEDLLRWDATDPQRNP